MWNPDGNAYTLQITVYDIGVVKIFQSFGSVCELMDVQSVTKESVTVAYKFQIISSGFTDVLHDVAVGHPFGDHREPSILEGIRNADKSEDIGMG